MSCDEPKCTCVCMFIALVLKSLPSTHSLKLRNELTTFSHQWPIGGCSLIYFIQFFVHFSFIPSIYLNSFFCWVKNLVFVLFRFVSFVLWAKNFKMDKPLPYIVQPTDDKDKCHRCNIEIKKGVPLNKKGTKRSNGQIKMGAMNQVCASKIYFECVNILDFCTNGQWFSFFFFFYYKVNNGRCTSTNMVPY